MVPYITVICRNIFNQFTLENYQEALLEIIDKSEIPVCYGGTAVDELGDPNCGQYVNCNYCITV